jgi:ABC-type proline/glycine betaine transport system ATPase subunit
MQLSQKPENKFINEFMANSESKIERVKQGEDHRERGPGKEKFKREEFKELTRGRERRPGKEGEEGCGGES